MKQRQLSFTFGVISSMALALAAVAPAAAAQPDYQPRPAAVFFEKLLRVPPQVLVLQTSSRNKQGVNGDANWPLYRDARGDDVIFDAAGPGRIMSLWGTAFDPAAVLQFYFDGEREPRLRVNILDLYKGRHPLFPPPLVSYEKRGMWGGEPFAGNSFVPIPFAKSLRISVKGESRFFHIIYEKYPYPADIATFTGREDRSALLDAFARLGEAPFDPASGLAVYPVETKTVEPGQTVSLLKIDKASGIVREIVLEADGADDFFQNTLLRMRWDGHSRWDVNAPTGLFFGSAVRANDVRSLPLRVEKLPDGRARLVCHLPMPFWDSAEIEWANTTARPMAPLKARISVGTNTVPRSTGTFFTTMAHSGETVYGHDWLLFEGQGAGWYVGTVQSMRTSHYCEGNEHITLDGAISPQINGTGTEDYYLACFWPNVDFDSPFACVAGDITREGGGSMEGAYQVPSSYARYHLEAPFPFHSSINARIQHGGQSDVRSEYRSLAFVYLRKSARLVETDFIDVGRPGSEGAHGYRSSQTAPPASIESYPEGDAFETAARFDGRYHAGGTIRFRVAVDPSNAGIRLRRLYDQKGPRQSARVFVDGTYAGTWHDANGNEFLRWAESDFDISPAFSRGKNSLDLELVVESDDGQSPFSDFSYKVYSLTGH
jgi:D-arabinan exo alpha-(1,3)/(1,5)-arabinofuranosidase (non-reducing end)